MMQTTFTDAERAFADSPAGMRDIALARRKHEAREAHKGSNARPFTDAMEVETVRALTTQDARTRVATMADTASLPSRTADALVLRDSAAVARKDRIRNSWKGR